MSTDELEKKCVEEGLLPKKRPRGNPPGVGNPLFGKSIKPASKPPGTQFIKSIGFKVTEKQFASYQNLSREQKNEAIAQFRQVIESFEAKDEE